MGRRKIIPGSAWALVTGAGSGIGRCYALRLAALGYHLVLAGNRREPLEAVAEEIRERAAAEGGTHPSAPRSQAQPPAGTRLSDNPQSGPASATGPQAVVTASAERVPAGDACAADRSDLSAGEPQVSGPATGESAPAGDACAANRPDLSAGEPQVSGPATGERVPAGDASAADRSDLSAGEPQVPGPATGESVPAGDASVADRSDLSAGEPQVSGPAGFCPAIRITAIDLARTEAAAELYAFTEREGIAINVLVNNAGTFSFLDILETPAERIERIILLHDLTNTQLCRLYADSMVRRGCRGHILNMSSYSLWMPFPGLALYSASKAYLRSFSVAFSKEVQEHGIRVTAVCPAGVATDLYGLTPRWQRIGTRLGVLITPDSCARRGLRALWRGRRSIVPDWWNRAWIPLCKILPMCVLRPVRRFTMKFQK